MIPSNLTHTHWSKELWDALSDDIEPQCFSIVAKNIPDSLDLLLEEAFITEELYSLFDEE